MLVKQLAIILLLFTTVAIVTDSSANTNTVSSTVLNNAPATANAPTVLNSNSDICKIGIGGSVQNNILGVATGTSSQTNFVSVFAQVVHYIPMA